MRTTMFYVVGVTGLALAVVFGLGAGIVWVRLAERRRLREEREARTVSDRRRPAQNPALASLPERIAGPETLDVSGGAEAGHSTSSPVTVRADHRRRR
jgi:hypothetical protein